MHRKVKEILNHEQAYWIPKIQSGASIEAALIKLCFMNTGVLLVMENEQVLGIFSEREFARALVLSPGLSMSHSVNEIMRTDVHYVTPDYRLDECMSLMTRMKVGHLPVVESGRVVSILSMRQIMEALVREKEFMIEELTRYVTSSPLINRERVLV